MCLETVVTDVVGIHLLSADIEKATYFLTE